MVTGPTETKDSGCGINPVVANKIYSPIMIKLVPIATIMLVKIIFCADS